MEKQFRVYVTNWRGGGNFYVKEAKTGRKMGLLFGSVRKKIIDALKDPEKAKDSFDYIVEIPGEPNPIPTFVERYELEYDGLDFGVLAHLTEKGVMRRALEEGGPRRYITPFGPMYR